MLEHLFGSKTRQKLLRLFFNNPQKDFFVRELTRVLNLQINAIRRELDHLVLANVIAQNDEPDNLSPFDEPSGSQSKRKYYRLNSKGLLNPELKALLIKDRSSKETGLIDDLKKLNSIEYLLLSGKFAGVENAVTDLLIVGDISSREIKRLIDQYEADSEEEVRYTLMSVKEYAYRRVVADKFLTDLISSKTIVVVDKLGKLKVWKK